MSVFKEKSLESWTNLEDFMVSEVVQLQKGEYWTGPLT